ncbi:MAG: helix-turn-helix domain-containing protein [Myxococcota bacterium]
MDYARQIQRGIDYIEANLEFDIELSRVSKVAGISHWHFQRIFKAVTGETLKTYIRSRRMANALDALLTTKAGILEIAFRAGFESQEAFTRAFKKAFGITPNAYRKLGNDSLFLKKVQIDAEYLRHLKSNVSLQPDIDDAPSMVLVGLQTFFYGVDSDKNNIGEALPPLWESFMARIGEIDDVRPGVCYGVIQPVDAGSARLSYHAAVEVSTLPTLPEGMVSVEIPAATYAHFTHRGPAENFDHTVNYIYSTWLQQSGFRHTYGPDVEIYGHEYHPTSPDSVMGYAIPIAKGS